MSPQLSHQMVIANAGSGKTYKLTTRMVALLMLGVEPRRIAALTFTKKAAGEFLDSVFQRLAGAATDNDQLEKLRRDTGNANINADKCLEVLRRLVGQMGVLCMGTIDGLFARIARAFPLESGLAGNFAMLGTSDLQAARDDAMAALFRESSGSPEIFDEFLDLVRQQSRKHSERGIFSALLTSAESLHAKYRETPPDVVWGDPGAIWPSGSPILSAGDSATAAAALRRAIEDTHPQLDELALAAWQSNLNLAACASADKAWPKDLEKFVADKLCRCSTDKKTGEEYIPTGGAMTARVYLNTAVSEARNSLLRALIKPQYEKLLRRSAALHAMMRRFESAYDSLTRSHARLTFSDITELLAARVDDPEWTSSVGYRLDARYDHWMLDEFQDTSRPQWKVLSSFIDEVIQDSGGMRSFFYVGDTKQAIYSWRGGDPKLFFEIRDLYNSAGEPRITSDTLTKSYRSRQEIMDVVNTVFGDIPAIQNDLGLSERTVTDWTQAWRKHVVAKESEGKSGFVRWVPVQCGKNEEAEEEDPRDVEILKILKETEPWLHGLSCAVLYRKNAKAAALAAMLRSEGIPVALEGNANPCTNNPLGSAILAALRFAASPDDTLSGCLLAGSPLNLLQNGKSDFRENTLNQVARCGFEETIRQWVSAHDLTLDPFFAACAADFLDAAAEFDSAGSGGILDFLAFVGSYQVQEPESTDAVRVMTVHQAKGLTFDMAITSGLDDRTIQTSDDLVLGGGNPPTWGMLLPGADFANQDPTLARATESLRADNEYGDLCTSYVAMTRPRFALYLITKQLGKTSKARNFARLLNLTLGDSFEFGNEKWFEIEKRVSSAGDNSPAVSTAIYAPISGIPKPVSPSNSTGVSSATQNPSGTSRDASKLGSEIHAALAEISWLEETPPAFPDYSVQAVDLLDAFFATPTARDIFRRPGTPCRLWREKPFDVCIDGRWVSGIFDRVHIHLHPDGHPAEAIIYDFKTDKAEPDEIQAHHAAQIDAYRNAASILLGLQDVAAEIVPIRNEK